MIVNQRWIVSKDVQWYLIMSQIYKGKYNNSLFKDKCNNILHKSIYNNNLYKYRCNSRLYKSKYNNSLHRNRCKKRTITKKNIENNR